jgi:alpha-galactosidase
VWVKPLMNDDWAVCFLNRSVNVKKIDFDWSKNIITDDFSKRVLNSNDTVYKIRDLWKKKNIGDTKKKVSGDIASHDVLMLRLTKH